MRYRFAQSNPRQGVYQLVRIVLWILPRTCDSGDPCSRLWTIRRNGPGLFIHTPSHFIAIILRTEGDWLWRWFGIMRTALRA